MNVGSDPNRFYKLHELSCIASATYIQVKYGPEKQVKVLY